MALMQVLLWLCTSLLMEEPVPRRKTSFLVKRVESFCLILVYKNRISLCSSVMTTSLNQMRFFISSSSTLQVQVFLWSSTTTKLFSLFWYFLLTSWLIFLGASDNCFFPTAMFFPHQSIFFIEHTLYLRLAVTKTRNSQAAFQK